MQLVYYRNQEGKITSHHNVPKDWTPEYLKEQIESITARTAPGIKHFSLKWKTGALSSIFWTACTESTVSPPTLSRPPKTPWARRWTALRAWR